MGIQNFIPFAIVIIITIAGFIIKYFEYKELISRLDFTFDYRNRFIELLNELGSTREINNVLYVELTEKVDSMQLELGNIGTVDMIDPLAGVQFNNYHLLINFLPKIRSLQLNSHYINSIEIERFQEEARRCDDAMIRHAGRLKETIKSSSKNRYNPFKCFVEGVQYVIWLPTNIFLWIGVISVGLAYKLKHNFLISIITALIAVAGLLSSIITIIVGWEESVEFLQRLLGSN